MYLSCRLSWGATDLVILLVGVVGTVFVVYITRLFNSNSIFLFFVMLLLYGLSIITMSFMMTPFFNKNAENAGAFAATASLSFSLLFLAVSYTRINNPMGSPESSIPVVGQMFLCLFSPVALAMAVDQVGLYFCQVYISCQLVVFLRSC